MLRTLESERTSPMHTEITDCRICSGVTLAPILNLGDLALTGVFPKADSPPVPAGPLRLVRCSACGLVQLAHNYDLSLLYGATYGYRSGLNRSMVRHLEATVRKIEALCDLSPGDVVVDIGSNDGTLLGSYRNKALRRIGIDPTGAKFRAHYQDGIDLIPEFFSAAAVAGRLGPKKAKVITSIAMFYDLERPRAFVDDIVRLLDDEGIWVFEQSYLPSMVATNSYDTICHEHLEYYCLSQILHLTRRAGLKIIDIDFNDTNGGSFMLVAAKATSAKPEASQLADSVLAREKNLGFDTAAPFVGFEENMLAHRAALRELLESLRSEGKLVLGYGASTKGNVLLQYCGLDRTLLPAIAEVNEEKFGSVTPGTNIPIVSERDARAMRPDYFLVLPWHFREGIIEREGEFLAGGGQLIFPLPELACVSRSGGVGDVSR
jgi:hypothetical protein